MYTATVGLWAAVFYCDLTVVCNITDGVDLVLFTKYNS